MTGFLASVKNLNEAKIASMATIDILDVKNVSDGALGFVGENIIINIRKKLPNHTISVTMGNDEDPSSIKFKDKVQTMINEKIDYIKIGLFNKRFIPQHKQLLKSLSLEKTKAVCVVFADLDFDINLIEDIIKCGYQGVMIDTHNKTDKSLIEILPIDIIKRFVKIIKKSKRICGLSGSLKLKHISILKDLSPDFLGFRGQICMTGRDKINIDLINQVAYEIRN